jgi:hypothetical protein
MRADSAAMKKGTYPRDVLNRLKWEEGNDIKNAKIVILHRGAPDNRMAIPGKDIISIGHMFFDTPETSIPFHRILEIWYNGRKIFEKAKENKEDD